MKKLIFLIITAMLSLTLSANPHHKLSSEDIEVYNILSTYEKADDIILSEVHVLAYSQTIKQDTIHPKKHKQKNYVDDDLYYRPSQNKPKEYVTKENKIILNDTLTWDKNDSLRFNNENSEIYFTKNIKDENSAPSFSKEEMNNLQFLIFFNGINRFNFSYEKYYDDFYFSLYNYTDSYFWYNWNYNYSYHNSFYYSYYNYNFYSYNYWYDFRYYSIFNNNYYYSYNYNNNLRHNNFFRPNEPMRFDRRGSSSNLTKPNINRRDAYNTQINKTQNISDNKRKESQYRQQNNQGTLKSEQNRRSSYVSSYNKPKIQIKPQYNNTRTSQTRSNYTTPSRNTTQQRNTSSKNYTFPSQSRTNYNSPSSQSRNSNYNNGSSNRSSSSRYSNGSSSGSSNRTGSGNSSNNSSHSSGGRR